MNKTELANKIRALDGLSNEDKTALLQLIWEHKKYGLVWEEKPEEIEDKLREQLPVLKEVPDRAILEGGPDAPNHILIEGDNLEALTTLSYTHEGKIDVIYIDPPYNRGENDFCYNDTFIAKDNPFKHSLWLGFMNKRIRLAKKLLSDKGVIIAHIDEHEYNSLFFLLEEIFTHSNNLGTIIWNKMNPKGDAQGVATMHEYIILFAKNRDVFLSQEKTLLRKKPNAEKMLAKAKSLFSKLGKRLVPEDVKQVIRPFGFSKDTLKSFEVVYTLELINKEFQNWLSLSSIGKGERAYKYISPDGRVFRSVSMAWPNKEVAPDDYWKPLFHPVTGRECPMPSKGWRNPSETMKRLLGSEEPYTVSGLTIKGEIVFSEKKNGNLNIPERIYYLDENMTENVPSIYNDGTSDDDLLSSIGIDFEYPKTVSVATYILSNILPSASIVLDFFAGSGTTLHAVMQLNAEDGGHRQCILCQGIEKDSDDNDKHICEKVTYERNKRVIQGYTKPNGEKVEGLKDNNLRYYRTDFVGRERTERNRRELMNKSTDLLCIKEDLYTELPKFGNIGLNPKGCRYFANDKKQMLVIYRPEFIPYFVEEIDKMEVTEPIKVYVYAPDRYAYDDEFAIVADKVSLCALPQNIIEAMARVMPQKSDKASDDAAASPAAETPAVEHNSLFDDLENEES